MELIQHLFRQSVSHILMGVNVLKLIYGKQETNVLGFISNAPTIPCFHLLPVCLCRNLVEIYVFACHVINSHPAV